MRQLIINGDDFGLHELINEGIIESHINGCLTSTTLMAGGPAFEHAVALAKQYPKLGVGVHLTLVGASPAARADISTLVTRDGLFFPSYKEFACQYIQGKIAKEHIRHELWCQMQKVIGSGIPITHLDSHQHLHVLPGMAEIIGSLAAEFHIEKIRIPSESVFFFGPSKNSFSRIAARTVLTACSTIAQHYYKKIGLSAPDHFYGMLSGGAMSQEVLQHIIKTLPEGVTEIMVHPGSDRTALSQRFTWGYRWQDELEALQSQSVLQEIKESGIQLISYQQLGRMQSALEAEVSKL